MQCVILAGGLGTRMYPVTKTIPKSMIEVNGQPFIHYQLKLLSSQNIKKVLLCIGYLGEEIKDFVKNGSQYNIEVDYLDEGSNLLGTGGALRLASTKNKLEESFFVTYGDSYLPNNWNDIKRAYENNIFPIMTTFKNYNKFDKSNVTYLNNKFIKYNKFNTDSSFKYIDYGLLVLGKKYIDILPQNKKCDLSLLLHNLSNNKSLRGFNVNNRFYEVGSLIGLNDFKDWLNSNEKSKLINHS